MARWRVSYIVIFIWSLTTNRRNHIIGAEIFGQQGRKKMWWGVTFGLTLILTGMGLYGFIRMISYAGTHF